jgi:hypothetical protein
MEHAIPTIALWLTVAGFAPPITQGKPIQITVGFSAGSGGDTMARLVALNHERCPGRAGHRRQRCGRRRPFHASTREQLPKWAKVIREAKLHS